MTIRYTIAPADGAHPAWIVLDRTTGRPVKALPPAEEPLRFYSHARAQAWVRRNSPAPEPAR
ncbi:hypothetical protein [Streptomyces sp. FH025]|uniref:hypothetical protein n=1 Tax=Streptomyces sp. FH025 TaxID=2815937 RepID=UPI001A9D9947|nr:hypothetical protein [Streptomyces sp. FH025]MBO1417355.1 hypothetical protein [Streptomyces sp. FH025]